VLQDYLSGGRLPTFLYPSAVDNFKRQFMYLEGQGSRDSSSAGGAKDGGGAGPPARHGVGPNGRPIMAATSLPRERVGEFQAEAAKYLPGRGGVESYSGGGGMAAAAAAAAAAQQQQQHAAAAAYAAQQQGAAAAAAAAALSAGQQQQQHAQVAAAAAAAAAAAYHQQVAAAQAQAQAQAQAHMAVDGYKTLVQQQQSVDALGCGVRNLSVLDHCGQPVPMAYGAPGAQLYPTNPILRSSSYQPAMQR
jgi:hypothetical protein